MADTETEKRVPSGKAALGSTHSRDPGLASAAPSAGAVAAVGLLILAVLAALYLGRVILLPLATALLISFVLRPLVRTL